MKRFFAFVVLAMVLIGFCAAQSAAADQRIVGTWTEASTVWVFNANGTGTCGGISFSFGISANGEIWIDAEYGLSRPGRGTFQLFMSPDGRRMIINGIIFQRN